MQITKENYFVASAAEFRAIPSKWTLALLRGGEKVRLGNQVFLKDHVSWSDGRAVDPVTGKGSYRSFSAYWVSADGSTLIRVSDHWCGTTSGIKKCQNIRSCQWWLLGKPRAVRTHGAWASGGIVRFRDMQAN